MARTIAEITAQISQEIPAVLKTVVDGVERDMTTAERNAYIAPMAQHVRAQELEEDERAAYLTMVEQFKAGMADLEADLAIVNAAIAGNTNLTQAQMRKGFKDILQSLIWLGERIKDGGIRVER